METQQNNSIDKKIQIMTNDDPAPDLYNEENTGSCTSKKEWKTSKWLAPRYESKDANETLDQRFRKTQKNSKVMRSLVVNLK